MIALFFEVEPHPGHEQAYLDLAAKLRPELDRNGGVTFLNRYRSLARPARMLSHQYWQDRTHLDAWRNHAGHRGVQRAGRDRHFADYRLRVGAVVAELRPGSPMQYLDGFEAARTGRRFVVAVEAKGSAVALHGGESFESVYVAGEMVSLSSFESLGEAIGCIEAVVAGRGVVAARIAAVERDYGPRSRAEAPADAI
ncbi:MAG TPA: antibiotic biosynthesis monooxygenase [Hyphomicrobiaceae bacterium]|nr:antibiotic biosynthesis monooxygenase [Hyphomicrobiaceae bacterium]